MPNWSANVSVMVLQCCKSSPQKSRPLESGHWRHSVWIAIEYSCKNEFKFLCELGWFLQIQSHILTSMTALSLDHLYNNFGMKKVAK